MDKIDTQTIRLNRLLEFLIKHNGSDLHIKSNALISARVNGDIVKITKDKFTMEDGDALAKELLGIRYAEFLKEKNIDFNYTLNNEYRFRVNMFLQIDGVSAVFRAIPMTIPTIDELNLPKVLKKIALETSRGIILVTGPTGCGKTTTIASMINLINENKPKHIISIEDPVEFIYKDAKSVVNQRALGQDCSDFYDALRAALREDPDVIFVGEIRDTITMETAIRAAETGHLVFSTLHTMDAKDTLNRVLGMFDGSEQNRIRMAFASVLGAVICQRLVRTVGNKRRAAVEIMIKNARIEDMILTGREHELDDAIKDGKNTYGMQTFGQHLLELYVNGVITMDEALEKSSNRADLEMEIRNQHLKTEDAKRYQEQEEVGEIALQDI